MEIRFCANDRDVDDLVDEADDHRGRHPTF